MLPEWSSDGDFSFLGERTSFFSSCGSTGNKGVRGGSVENGIT